MPSEQQLLSRKNNPLGESQLQQQIIHRPCGNNIQEEIFQPQKVVQIWEVRKGN